MGSASAPITYRPTAETDLQAAFAVFDAAEGGLYRAHNYPWSTRTFELWAPIHRHLLSTDPGRCHVAEVDGRVVGFTEAVVRGTTWYLSALFVDPAFQGRGIGNHLFKLAIESAPAKRMTITDSIQPISNALYARHGLIPTTPILRFSGRPRVGAPPDLTRGDVTPELLAHLDRAAYGFDHRPDHGFWARSSEPTVWVRDGDVVAYAYVAEDGTIAPLVGLDEAAASAALQAVMAGRAEVSVEIPGTARSLVETALAAGLRIDPPPGLLLLSRDAPAPTCLAIASYWLL